MLALFVSTNHRSFFTLYIISRVLRNMFYHLHVSWVSCQEKEGMVVIWQLDKTAAKHESAVGDSVSNVCVIPLSKPIDIFNKGCGTFSSHVRCNKAGCFWNWDLTFGGFIFNTMTGAWSFPTHPSIKWLNRLYCKLIVSISQRGISCCSQDYITFLLRSEFGPV